MRVARGDHLRSIRGRLKPVDWLSWAERLLLAMLALLLAALAWAILTPVGSFGAWTGRQAHILSMAERQALFSSFDPFFRSGAQQPGGGVVTSLALTVYGIRLNEGSGQGSAIIAGPDGVQNSFAVGDEIMPGVLLKGVSFDHVTIDRGGTEEQLFLDQSQPVPVADAVASTPASISFPGAVPNPTADSIRRDIGVSPRMENARVTGLVLTARGPGYQQAGFLPGDIITRIDGQPVGSVSDISSLQGRIVPGARISLTVERGASTATINLTLQGP